jgi:hypothetical protein
MRGKYFALLLSNCTFYYFFDVVLVDEEDIVGLPTTYWMLLTPSQGDYRRINLQICS